MDSTDFGESIRHVSAFAAAAEYAESSPKKRNGLQNDRRPIHALAHEFATRIGAKISVLNFCNRNKSTRRNGTVKTDA
jgi:hypothetical protein